MSRLTEALSRNWTLKLSSFGLAVFLWAVVRAEPADREVLSQVPVRVQINDLEWTLAAPPEPAAVQVRFAGPAREILRIDRERAAVQVLIDEVVTPDSTISLRRDWVTFDGATGLVVQDIVPGAVQLAFERTAQEPVPLVVRTRGQLPADRALALPIGLAPQVVRVRGPARIVENLDSVPLEPLDLSQIRESGTVEVAIDTTGLGNLTFATSRASLSISVEEAVERVLPPIDIEVQGPAAAGLIVEPVGLSVAVRGTRTRVETAPLDSLRLVIPAEVVQDLAPGEQRTVAVRLQGLPSLLQARPAVDSVVVRRPVEGTPTGEGEGGPGSGGREGGP